MADSLKYLSTAFNKENNVLKLVKTIDQSFDELEKLLRDIKDSHFINKADGRSLDFIDSLFNVKRRINESDERYRIRIKLEVATIFNSATINDVKNLVAAALQTKTARVKVKETDYTAFFRLGVFRDDLEKAGVTREEFIEFAHLIKPVGVRLFLFEQETFTHRGINDSNDPTKAYNDLNNSNPNAGTYAGLF